MRKFALTLTYLAFAGQGRRVQHSFQKLQRRAARPATHVVSGSAPIVTDDDLNALEALDALLLNFDPAAAFTPSRLRVPIREANLPNAYRSFVVHVENSPRDTPTDENSILRLTQPRTGQQVTIIGVQHLSPASNGQVVVSELRSNQPDAVVVELDRGRLSRLKLTDADFVVPFRTSEDIALPQGPDDIAEAERVAAGDGWWWRPAWSAALAVYSRAFRQALTFTYARFGEKKDGTLPGGEFAAAISAANELGVPCVLADRDAYDTIARAADLVRRSDTGLFGLMLNAFGLAYIGSKVLQPVLEDLKQRSGHDNISMVDIAEELRRRPDVIERMTEKWREDVPEFSRAFVEERDYIMAKAISRELDGPAAAKHVCAVVGVGHLFGIQRNLEADWQQQAISA